MATTEDILDLGEMDPDEETDVDVTYAGLEGPTTVRLRVVDQAAPTLRGCSLSAVAWIDLACETASDVG